MFGSSHVSFGYLEKSFGKEVLVMEVFGDEEDELLRERVGVMVRFSCVYERGRVKSLKRI